jgi:hypothetical protein
VIVVVGVGKLRHSHAVDISCEANFSTADKIMSPRLALAAPGRTHVVATIVVLLNAVVLKRNIISFKNDRKDLSLTM